MLMSTPIYAVPEIAWLFVSLVPARSIQHAREGGTRVSVSRAGLRSGGAGQEGKQTTNSAPMATPLATAKTVANCLPIGLAGPGHPICQPFKMLFDRK
jgi:hypothetical protein